MEENFQSGDSKTLENLQYVISKQEIEINALKNKIEELSNHSQNTSLVNIDTEQSNLTNLQSIIIKHEQENIALKADVDMLTYLLKNRKASLENVAEKNNAQTIINDLELTAKDLRYENKCLRACLLPLSPQADNSALLELEVKNNEKLQNEVQELKNRLEDQNFWKIENSDVYQELRRQYNILEAKHDEQQYMIKSLLETKKKLKCVEEDMSVLHGKYQETLHRNNILQSEMEAEIKQYKNISKEAESENFLLKEKLRESKGMLNANAAEKIIILEEKVKQLHEEKQNLEEKLTTDRGKLGNILGRLEQSIRYHKKQKTDLLTEIDQLNIKLCELRGVNSSLEITLGENQQLMEGITNNKIIQLQNELALIKTDKMLLEERLLAFNKQHDSFVTQIKGCAMKQVDDETEIIQLQTKLNKELHINNQLEQQLNEAKGYTTELNENVKQRTAELEKEVTHLKAKYNIAEKERDLVVCENNELTLKIADLQKNSSKLHNTCIRLDATIKENTTLKSELEMIRKQYQGKITNTKKIIQQLKSENISLKTQVNDLINTMKVEDNIDLLVQDRLIEKKSLHEKIQQLQASYQELEIKYNKNQQEIEKQSKYYKNQIEELQIEKDTQIQNLIDENKKNLSLAKFQYDKDIQFIHGRHNDSILKLQGMHEDGIKEKIEEHETEKEDLRAQKQAYRDALRKKRREVEELRDQITDLQKEHNKKIGEMQTIFESDRKKSTENISRLTQRCWIELEKIQIINKENQYIKTKVENEVLFTEKRSEFEEIESRLNHIQIDGNIKSNDHNETMTAKDPTETISCSSNKFRNLLNCKRSEFQEIETNVEDIKKEDTTENYENDETIESNDLIETDISGTNSCCSKTY